MATSMDVDPQEEPSSSMPPPPPPSLPPGGDSRILVHPLAIVAMSDQYTRIRCGGSPLDSDAPVTGLLLGTARTQTTTTAKSASSAKVPPSSPSPNSSAPDSHVVVEVRDAEDIPLDLSESAQLQEELHRAVFPTHKVVGWYRVAETDDVLESDVVLTDRLALHYRKKGSSSVGGDSHPFLFALLAMNDSKAGGGSGSGSSPAKRDDDEDEPLPLTVYRAANDGGVLHNVPDWTLETLDSERIAVERVIREQPPPPVAAGSADDPSADVAAAASANAMTSLSLDGPRFVQHTHTIEHSLSSIHRRLDVLRTYLWDTADGRIPWNPSLMRQVNEVMLQAEAIHRPYGNATNGDGDPDALLVPVAYLLKTVDAVRSYSDKFEAVQESYSSSSALPASGMSTRSSRDRDRDFKRL